MHFTGTITPFAGDARARRHSPARLATSAKSAAATPLNWASVGGVEGRDALMPVCGPTRAGAEDKTTLRTPKVRARGVLAMAVLVSVSVQAEPQKFRAQEALSQCWTPEALSGTPKEKRIEKNVERAYKGLPAGQPRTTRLPEQWRGVIRRVDLPPGVMKVALTFDLCEQPHEIAGYDGAIVDLLRETHTRATFFAGGKWIANHDERARQLIADPLFDVGNHGWEHRNLRLARGQRLLDEINAPQLAYGKVYAGLVRDQCVAPDRSERVREISPQPGLPWLFRFPFGACDAQSLRAVADAGLLAIQWDLSSGDPMRHLSAAHMASAVVHGARPGSIVLFHANGRGWQTAQALRVAIPALRARGFELVTVSDLLNTEGARPVMNQICYDARPGDTNRYDNIAKRLEATYDAFDVTFGSRSPKNKAKAGEPVVVSPPFRIEEGLGYK